MKNPLRIGASIRFHLSRFVALAVVALSPCIARGEPLQTEDWNLKLQSTYVFQYKPAFGASYSGAHSLLTSQERSYSFTGTAAIGVRLWQGAEFYFNPEVAQGVPLSHLTGLGGFTNGEIARTAGQTPVFYRARLFLRQTFGLGGEREQLPSEANQLAGVVDKRRLVITAGNVSVLDIFDDNAFSHDARTQFLNWSLFTHGAWDFAADARGYTWGLALEYYFDDWAVRAGRFIQPKQPNQQALDSRILRHYGDQIEIEHGHTVAGQDGKIRVLAFRNRARMSRFRDALEFAALNGGTPDINNVRFTEQVKYGFGLNLEQNVTGDVGIFARGSWADGQTETYAFTEIDRSLSAGASIKGQRWGRPEDTLGLAFVRNGLSRAHRDYLAAGGLGFFIGDGQLNYRPENIFETFYSLRVIKGAWVSADFQRIFNPAYNADRGPVSVGTVRLHAEF
jgi:high affinity Mn2+ porin